MPIDSTRIRYNDIRQRSIHNSYARVEGIYDQMLYWRVRSLEVDLWRWSQNRERLTDDWFIFHIRSLDERTSVDKLSDFLDMCRGFQKAIPDHEVVTVFVDHKEFHRPGASGQFDALVRAKLGRAVYEPSRLLGNAASLQEAVTARGWPTLDDLRGKFIFVMTGAWDSQRKYIDRGRSCWVEQRRAHR